MKLKARKKNSDVKKDTVFSVIINGLQCVLALAIALVVCIPPYSHMDMVLMKVVVVLASAVVIWGAVVDIRDAFSTRKLLTQVDDMDDTIDSMEEFNNTLRVQRHDFLNHLQVVYSLIEMEEYDEASKYIEKVYGSVTSISTAMKTACPAVNALLQVKLPACEKAGINAELIIESSWKYLPMPGWEMCKVLSNLIDNAMDALGEKENDRTLTITLTEDVKNYRFSIADNGPMIPEKMIRTIFSPGITTKSEGHGMGLYIVRETLQKYEGEISVLSDSEKTDFIGYVPKAKEQCENEEK